MPAHRLRAPAVTLMAVCPSEPPTGWPPKTPDARLPIPWDMKSVFERPREPSGFGAISATPAPCTSTMAATEAAPISTWIDSALREGKAGSGIPVGISPTSLTWATLSAPTSRTSAVGTIRATSEANSDNGVRETNVRMSSAPRPASKDAGLISLGFVRTFQAFSMATEPCDGAPVSDGIWLSTMLTATPDRKPSITDCETNRV